MYYAKSSVLFLVHIAQIDSDLINYPNDLKFGTNVYVLYKISSIILGAHCPKSTQN